MEPTTTKRGSRRTAREEAYDLYEAKRQGMHLYTSRVSYIYMLLALDVVITTVADTAGDVQGFVATVATLIAQLSIRLFLLLVAASLLASIPSLRTSSAGRGSWHLDSLMLAFRSFFATQLMAVLVCLFLRVYRVMLASYKSDFPTIRSQWEQPAYHVLYYLHMATSLLYYYFTVSSCYTLGEYFSDEAIELSHQT